MIRSYLNQTALYRKCIDTDDRGQPIYGAPVSLPCRRQRKAKNVLSSDGQSTIVQNVYYLSGSVSTGDLLDGLIITDVTDMVSLGGVQKGYKAVT